MHAKIAEIISTVFYIGRIKYAPGTFGSLTAFPLCYIIMYFVLNNKIVFHFDSYSFQEQQIFALFIIEIAVSILLFIIGTYFTSVYIKDMAEKDPKEVVIDEVVGQMLTIIFCSFSVIFASQSNLPLYFDNTYIDVVFALILPFLLFRFFDAVKPWPINWLDRNIKGALGVMIDDVAAAFFAIIVHYAIVFFILDFYV
ncbi:MAG: phosphatidylglycerophosphatase A [Rickettsiales bacterium]|nr:MAG: phosphatidylglycerophosphatase A [Rickettsiales bacterium]